MQLLAKGFEMKRRFDPERLSPFKPLDEYLRQRARELKEAEPGLPYRIIALRLGVSEKSVSVWCRATGSGDKA